MNEKKTLNRFAYVDTLRGLAALYVLFYHLALLPNPDLEVPYWAKRIVLSGGTGVTLFFCSERNYIVLLNACAQQWSRLYLWILRATHIPNCAALLCLGGY